MFTKRAKVIPVSTISVLQTVIDSYNQPFWHFTDEVRTRLLMDLKNEVLSYFSPCIDLTKFNYFYLTNGITDGLNYYSSQNHSAKFKILPGDYAYLNLFHQNQTEEIFYISNPSAIDGNYIDDSTFKKLCSENPRVILDCAYLGTAKNKKIEMHENIEAVFLGLSKTLGIPDTRIGFIFSKKKINLLDGIIYGNSYFNMTSCLTSIRLLKEFEFGYIYKKYKSQQEAICNEYNIVPSDVCIFATSTDPQYNSFKRGTTNRICITEKMERE